LNKFTPIAAFLLPLTLFQKIYTDALTNVYRCSDWRLLMVWVHG